MNRTIPAIKRAVSRLIHEERALAQLQANDTALPLPGLPMKKAIWDQKRKTEQARRTYDRRMELLKDRTWKD